MIGKLVVPLRRYPSCFTPPQGARQKEDITNKYPVYKAYMGLIKGYHPKGSPPIFPMNIIFHQEKPSHPRLRWRFGHVSGEPKGPPVDVKLTRRPLRKKSQQTSPPEQRRKKNNNNNNPDSQGYFEWLLFLFTQLCREYVTGGPSVRRYCHWSNPGFSLVSTSPVAPVSRLRVSLLGVALEGWSMIWIGRSHGLREMCERCCWYLVCV